MTDPTDPISEAQMDALLNQSVRNWRFTDTFEEMKAILYDPAAARSKKLSAAWTRCSQSTRRLY